MPIAKPNSSVRLNVPARAASAKQLFSVPVPFVSQEPNRYQNLCWAACGTMILRYWARILRDEKFNVKLSNVVSGTQEWLGKPNCTPAKCDKDLEPWLVYDAFGFGYDRVKNLPLAPDNVEELIRAEIPIEVYWKWNGGPGGHVVLIVGLYEDGDLQIFDPNKTYNPPQSGDKLSYDQVLCAVHNRGSWQDTLTNFVPPGRGG
jgi:hypothetical protein